MRTRPPITTARPHCVQSAARYEDIELISQGVKSGNWVDTTLGVVGASLDGLALVSDPVGALLQYGVAWIIEHLKPLSQALDWLAGDPAQIAANAQTWRNVARSIHDEAAGLDNVVSWDVSDWTGAGGDAYRTWSRQQQNSLTGLAKAAETMAAITEGNGFLIAAVRMLVRDAIATLVSRLIPTDRRNRPSSRWNPRRHPTAARGTLRIRRTIP
jgi:uncharacterized protein YukE